MCSMAQLHDQVLLSPDSIHTGCVKDAVQGTRHLAIVFLLLIQLAAVAVIYYSPSNTFSTYGSICFLCGLFKGPCYPLGYLNAKLFSVSGDCRSVQCSRRRRHVEKTIWGRSAPKDKRQELADGFFPSLHCRVCPSLLQAGMRSHRRKPSSVFLLLRGQLLQREIYPLA